MNLLDVTADRMKRNCHIFQACLRQLIWHHVTTTLVYNCDTLLLKGSTSEGDGNEQYVAICKLSPNMEFIKNDITRVFSAK